MLVFLGVGVNVVLSCIDQMRRGKHAAGHQNMCKTNVTVNKYSCVCVCLLYPFSVWDENGTFKIGLIQQHASWVYKSNII